MSKIAKVALLEFSLYAMREELSKNGSDVLKSLNESVRELKSTLLEADDDVWRDVGFIHTRMQRDKISTYDIEAALKRYGPRSPQFVVIVAAMHQYARGLANGNINYVSKKIIEYAMILYPYFKDYMDRIIANDDLSVVIRDKNKKVVSVEPMANVRQYIGLYDRKVYNSELDREQMKGVNIYVEALMKMLCNQHKNADSFSEIEGQVYHSLMFSLPKVARAYQRKGTQIVSNDAGGEDGFDIENIAGDDFSQRKVERIPALQWLSNKLKVGKMTPWQIEKYFMIPLEYGCVAFAHMLTKKPSKDAKWVDGVPGEVMVDVDGVETRLKDILMKDYAINPDGKDIGQAYNTYMRSISGALRSAIESGELSDFENRFKMSLSDISKILCTGENEKYRIDPNAKTKKSEMPDNIGDEESEEDEIEVLPEPAAAPTLKLNSLNDREYGVFITKTLKAINPSKVGKFLEKYRDFIPNLTTDQKNEILQKHPDLREELFGVMSESTKNRWSLISGIKKVSE